MLRRSQRETSSSLAHDVKVTILSGVVTIIVVFALSGGEIRASIVALFLVWPSLYIVEFLIRVIDHVIRPSHHPRWKPDFYPYPDGNYAQFSLRSMVGVQTPSGIAAIVRPPDGGEFRAEYGAGIHWTPRFTYPSDFPGAPALSPGRYRVIWQEQERVGERWWEILRTMETVPNSSP
jgi:hypothetical protein